MKKIVSLVLVLFGGLALGLSGCGKSAQEKLAEQQLKEKAESKVKEEAYYKNMAKELEKIKKQ